MESNSKAISNLVEGSSIDFPSSSGRTYILKLIQGVYSCNCPAWRNQRQPIENRTCKHLVSFRGISAEEARLGAIPIPKSARKQASRSTGTLSFQVALADKWTSEIDPTGWHLSEKFDGVRAYWDGNRLLSRTGKLLYAPDWFLKCFSPFSIDGELFGGRQQFQHTISIVKRQDKNKDWHEIQYLIFDAPQTPGPFETRLRAIQEWLLEHSSPSLALVKHQICTGAAHLQQELERVLKLGGEGLMLKHSTSEYTQGRSMHLLKVKITQDADALVIGHEPGTGKYEGLLGALKVEMPNGKVFKIGTGFKDRDRELPPPIDAIVTFKYQELTKGGIPRFPVFVRIREDLAWDTIIQHKSPTKTKTKIKKTIAMNPITTTEIDLELGKTYHFEYSDEKSYKFWEITLQEQAFTVRYGRIGTDGRINEKTFDSVEETRKNAIKVTKSKLGKGYELIT